jgi:NADH:ubiquinone oxidoreductase subunit E
VPAPVALESILSRHPAGRRDALIPLLSEVQAGRGWLTPEDVMRIADHVGVPDETAWHAIRISGTFRLEPPGRWPIRVCVGTSCQVRGAQATLTALQSTLGLPLGGTSADGSFSLHAAACFGACSFAPVVEVAGSLRLGLDAAAVPGLIRELRGEGAPARLRPGREGGE